MYLIHDGWLMIIVGVSGGWFVGGISWGISWGNILVRGLMISSGIILANILIDWLDWIGLDWIWFDLIWLIDLIWFDLIDWFDLIWFDLIWFDLIDWLIDYPRLENKKNNQTCNIWHRPTRSSTSQIPIPLCSQKKMHVSSALMTISDVLSIRCHIWFSMSLERRSGLMSKCQGRM